MREKLRIMIFACIIISLLPFQFAFAEATLTDRNGDGIHIDDFVDYLIQSGTSSRSEVSELLNQIVPVMPEVPGTPTNVIAAAADSKVDLSWSPVADSTYYNVYQSLDNATYQLINAPDAITSAMYEVSGLTNGVVYYFKITAAKSGAESVYSDVVNVTPGPTAADVAVGITSVMAPAADETSLTVPTVPSGYSIAIFSSSNTEVVGTNGAIVPPAVETTVDLKFTVTRLSDGNSANTSAIMVTVPAKSNGEPLGYTLCASENQVCNFSGIASVAYGANGYYYYKTFLTTTLCGNDIFGDPIGGTVKSCYYQTIAEPTAAEVASAITSVTAPVADATSLTLPTVLDGYSIAIASSSDTELVDTNGVIVPPATATSVDLVFTVTRLSDSKSANTGTITVTVPAHILTAGEVAEGITSVTAPVADATSLTLPTVPDGYSIAIASSNNTEVVGTNGAIVPPATETGVGLVFTVTRLSDSKSASTGTITVTVPAHILTAGEVAEKITSVTAPAADATSLTMPTVPDGYSIAILSSSNTVVVSTYGVIVPPATAIGVDLVFTITRLSDSKSASTGTITVTVPAHVLTATEVIAAGITSVTAPAADATSLTMPTVPDGYSIAITYSSNTAVISTYGVIAPPSAPIDVELKFTVTRLSNGDNADTGLITVTVPANGGPEGYTFCAGEGGTCNFSGSASVAYGAEGQFHYKTIVSTTPCTNAIFGDPISGVGKSCYYQLITGPTAEEVAAGITSVTAPAPNATSLTMPTVPDGYTIAIFSSSNTAVVGTNGVIAPPSAETNVNLVFKVTRTVDGTYANTIAIKLIVPSYVAASRTGTNVALATNLGVASAFTTHNGDFPVSSINDGDIRGAGWGHGGGWNDDSAGSFPDWVQIDFNGSKTINEIDVFTLRDDFGSPSDPIASTTFTQYGIVDFTVQYWSGSAWVTVTNGDVTGNNFVWRQFPFSPVVTNKIKVTVNKAVDGYSRIIEVEAWSPSDLLSDTPV